MTAKSVQIVVFSKMSFLDVAGPLDVFSTANDILGFKAYNVLAMSLSPNVSMSGGIVMQVEQMTTTTAPPHTFIVPGGPGIEDFCKDANFESIFVPLARQAHRLASVCTGAYALAAAQLLINRRVTTHWSAFDDFEARFPDVSLERGPIFVNDGHVWTSAGVTAGIDLALALVEKDFGQSVSLKIARHLVMFLKRPGDQSQFSSPLTLQSKSGLFSDLHAWIAVNLANNLTTEVLAKKMNMSERSFLRHYKKQTGNTPAKVVETLRLEAARELLCYSHTSLKEVAARCGFRYEATLARRFTNAFNISPGQYRLRFGSALKQD